MTKKKIAILTLFILLTLALTGCGKNEVVLNDYVIEQRENLFTASDDLYTVNFSTGLRETDYNFDGVVNEMIPFGVLTITRNNNLPLSNDTYAYMVNINDQNYTGFLEKSATDNSYSADLEVNTIGDEKINVQVSFTGYTFNSEMENVSSSFQVDYDSALKLANKELKSSLKNLTSDKNTKIEVVTKIMKDYSSTDLKRYYWYVGVISSNGDTVGVLLDTNTGDIIAKKC